MALEYSVRPVGRGFSVVSSGAAWQDRVVILSLLYVIVRQILAVVVLLVRRDVSKEVELLVLRHENAALRRSVPRIPVRAGADHTAVPPVTDLTAHRVRRTPILAGLINECRAA